MQILNDTKKGKAMSFEEFQNNMPANKLGKIMKWVNIISIIYKIAKEIFILFLAYKFFFS